MHQARNRKPIREIIKNSRDMAGIELKEDRIKKAFALSSKTHRSDKLYLVEKIRGTPSEVIIGFPGFGSVKDWFSETAFGGTKINPNLFPSLKSVGNNEAALVNKAFLQRFETLVAKPSFRDEVEVAMMKGKQVVFTGHSSGAAVAILATLWALDEYITPNTNRVLTPNTNRIPPLCVTFGSPLVGNHIFSHATRRENWSGYFTHFVMKHDIVPRLLLAPLSSYEQRFDPVLQFFNPKSKSFMDVSIGSETVTSEFYSAVMRNAATTTSHVACKLMGSNNAIPEMLESFISFSPYRPFGTYVFCTGSGKLIVIRNPEAVLQLLFFSAQSRDEAEAAQVALKCLKEHVFYGNELKESLTMQDVIYLDQLGKLPLSGDGSDGSDGDIAAINIALNDLGLTTRAIVCLQAAGELEEQKKRNEGKINKQKAETYMKKVEEYKTMNETQKVGYYDAFKVQNNKSDFHSNVHRLELAGIWDEIIEMLKRYELPDEFERNPEWIELGNEFRRLVEPLDIANYYRHVRNDVAGPYMDRGRPRRYKYPQRWLEHKDRKAEGACSESCFLAEVEELCIKTRNSPFEDVKEEVLKLESDIKRWNEEQVLTKDVFLEGSTFVKWWKNLPQQHKESSCIKSLVRV